MELNFVQFDTRGQHTLRRAERGITERSDQEQTQGPEEAQGPKVKASAYKDVSVYL